MKQKIATFQNVATQISYRRLLKNLKEVVRNSLSRKWFLIFIILFLFSLSTRSSFAEINLQIPAEYGEVIYQYPGKDTDRVFIIGISHRDFLTLFNGKNTPKVQAEIYRIGDWFIRNQGVELLLPEGYFKNPAVEMEKVNSKTEFRKGSRCEDFSDTKALEEWFSDDKTYVNAEMLLKKSHRLRTEQVQDKELYDAVSRCLVKLNNSRNSFDSLLLESEVDYLQQRRTAAMLQKIPEIIEKEFRQRNIKSRKAMFTIGLYHLHYIIKYLNETRIKIKASQSGSNGDKDYVAGLTLQKENFDISVIIPRTLADDPKILEINELDKIVREYQNKYLTFH